MKKKLGDYDHSNQLTINIYSTVINKQNEPNRYTSVKSMLTTCFFFIRLLYVIWQNLKLSKKILDNVLLSFQSNDCINILNSNHHTNIDILVSNQWNADQFFFIRTLYVIWQNLIFSTQNNCVKFFLSQKLLIWLSPNCKY